jgi:hypothetical protein
MTRDDQYEPNRVLGIPLGSDTRARQDEESQRVLGFSADWPAAIDLDWVRALAHPVRGYRRWLRRRRLGPYAMDDGERAARRLGREHGPHLGPGKAH